MDINQEQNNLISIYSSSIIGICLSLYNLKKIQVTSKHIEENISTPSVSKEEEEHEQLFPTDNKFLSKNELKFFRDMGYYFIKENLYFFFIFLIFAPIILGISYFWLHWSFGLCFILGYLEFLFTFWITRKMFIKMMLRMNLKNDAVELKYHNWDIFTRFIMSALLVLNLSTVIFSVSTILVGFSYFFDYINKDLVQKHIEFQMTDQTPTQNSETSKYTQFQIFFICYAFYLVGKNLLAIFNNMWYSYHINRNTLRYLKIFKTHENKLINQSYGFYYNMMSQITKHNIMQTEVIVIVTLGLFEYDPKLTIFFIMLSSIILIYFICISLILGFGYNFKHLREFMKMVTIIDTGFIYYFILFFIFLFYTHFINGSVLLLQRTQYSITSDFNFCYLMSFFLLIIDKSYQLYFVSTSSKKKNKKFDRAEMYNYNLNLKLFLKMFFHCFFLYVIFLFFGFIAMLFFLFFLTFESIFYKMRKLVLTFNMYIKTILLFCDVCRVHHINFNKLLNVADKSYFYNYFLLLFCIPLYHHHNSLSITDQSPFSIMKKLFIIVISHIISEICLVIYSRLLVISYKEYMKFRREDTTQQQRIMKLIRERHFFFIICGLLYLSYIYLFYFYLSYSDLLCVVLGISIHFFQLIFKNKIRIKKYWESPYKKNYNVDNFMMINEELGKSSAYLQSVCELSFVNIILDIAKILLITQFVLNFIKKKSV
jgi:hypothetical protein